MLDVVGELVRRVAEAAVLEVDQPGDLPVPHHVGRVEVGDAEGGRSRGSGSGGCGDVGAGGVQRLRRPAPGPGTPPGRGRRRATRPASRARARARRTCRGPIPASRTASTGTSYSRRSDAPSACVCAGVSGRGASGSPGSRSITITGVSPSSRRSGRGARPGACSASSVRIAHSRSASASWSATNSLRTSRLADGHAVGGRLHRADLRWRRHHAHHHLRRTRQDRPPPGSHAGRGGARGHLGRSATPTTSPTSRPPVPPHSSPRWRTPTRPRSPTQLLRAATPSCGRRAPAAAAPSGRTPSTATPRSARWTPPSAAGVERYVMVSFSGSTPDALVPEDNPFRHYQDAKIAADEHLRGTDLGVDGPRPRHADPRARHRRGQPGRRLQRRRRHLARARGAGRDRGARRRPRARARPSSSATATSRSTPGSPRSEPGTGSTDVRRAGSRQPHLARSGRPHQHASDVSSAVDAVT